MSRQGPNSSTCGTCCIHFTKRVFRQQSTRELYSHRQVHLQLNDPLATYGAAGCVVDTLGVLDQLREEFFDAGGASQGFPGDPGGDARKRHGNDAFVAPYAGRTCRKFLAAAAAAAAERLPMAQ